MVVAMWCTLKIDGCQTPRVHKFTWQYTSKTQQESGIPTRINPTVPPNTIRQSQHKYEKSTLNVCRSSSKVVLNNLLKDLSYTIGTDVYYILATGATELIFCNTKPIVVINEFTNLAASMVPEYKIGVINAVLDNIFKNNII